MKWPLKAPNPVLMTLSTRTTHCQFARETISTSWNHPSPGMRLSSHHIWLLSHHNWLISHQRWRLSPQNWIFLQNCREKKFPRIFNRSVANTMALGYTTQMTWPYHGHLQKRLLHFSRKTFAKNCPMTRYAIFWNNYLSPQLRPLLPQLLMLQ